MATISNPKPNPTPPQPLPPDPADPITPTPTRIHGADFLVSAPGHVLSVKSTSILVLCSSILVLSAVAPSRAQPHPEEPCRVGTQNETPQALNEKLQDCEGVLKPPRVGDADMAVEPPVNSEMPVISPGDLPGQS